MGHALTYSLCNKHFCAELRSCSNNVALNEVIQESILLADETHIRIQVLLLQHFILWRTEGS